MPFAPLMTIGGRRLPAADAATFRVFEPATRRHLADVPAAGEADVALAVAAARRAFDEGPWPRMSDRERAEILGCIATRLQDESAALAELEAKDTGSTIRKTRDADVPGAVGAFVWSAHWARTVPDRLAPARRPGAGQAAVCWRPYGVVASIIPWNLPLLLASWRIAPVIAAGNCVVVKPASFASLTTLRLVELMHECGLPAGVVNVVSGLGAVVGDALVRSRGVDHVAFTGSDNVGAQVSAAAATAGTGVRLDLAGKSPNIVLPDADLRQAADGVARSIFFHNGQICMAGSRAVVHRAVYDEFLELVTDRATSLRLGDPLDPATDLGPLVNRAQARTARRFAAAGVAEGARLLCGGRPPAELPGAGLDAAAYCEPTVLADVHAEHTVAREEIFGPVLSVLCADSEQDAVRLANASRYDLSAGVWSQDPDAAERVAAGLRASRVWVNDYCLVDLALPDPDVPFDAVWERVTNEVDQYRRRQSVNAARVDRREPVFDLAPR